MLLDAGVDDVEALRRLGPIEAYRRLRFRFGRRATVNFIYALECATQNMHWRDLSARRKDELKRAARDIDASLSLRSTAKPRR